MFSARSKVKVIYDGVDISADISNGLLSFTYKDKVSGQTDDLDLQIEDVDGLWKTSWYPTKKSTLSAKLGYDDNLVECGTFKIDEIEFGGPPDTVNIRATAVFPTSKLRTKKSKNSEGITLKQLAENVCKEHELTLDDGTTTVKLKRPDTLKEQAELQVLSKYARDLGAKENTERYLGIAALQINTFKVIRQLTDKGYQAEADLLASNCKFLAANMTKANCFKFSSFCSEIIIVLANTSREYTKTTSIGLNRITLGNKNQFQETDLAFLNRISNEYGFAFSIKGTVMVFYNIKTLEGSKPVTIVDKLQLISYSFKDKTSETASSVTVKHHNPDTKQTVTSTAVVEEQTAENGETYTENTSEDSIEIKSRAENTEQAEAMAKSELHARNSKAQEGSFSVVGDPLLVAGNNFELTGFGMLNGTWHVTESTHSVTKSGGYTTDVEIKRVARKTGEGSGTSSRSGKKRGDTTKEQAFLKAIQPYAIKASKYENATRYLAISAILRQTYPIVQSLYQKNCDKEARELQANCELINSDKSRLSCVKFAGFCEKIRKELFAAKN